MSQTDAGIIRSQCKLLKKIVRASSLDFHSETRLLNNLKAIAQLAGERPEDADYRLKAMARYLKETDNGRGEPILSGEQYDKFCFFGKS